MTPTPTLPRPLCHPLWLPAMALAVAFGRLMVAPGALLVDGERPAVDDTMRAEALAVGNDLTRVLLPHHLRIAADIRRVGRLPAWDPAGFGGRPRVGNPQAGLWYPPAWLAWVAPWPATLGWITVAHLLGAGLGVFLLTRGVGADRFSAAVAAGCFAASPYVLGQVAEGHYPHVWSASWTPWAFLAALRWQRGDRGGGLALPPILALSLLTGHPQEGYYLLIALSLWAAWLTVAETRGKRTWKGVAHVAGSGGVIVLVAGLVAIEAIPDALAQGWTMSVARLSLKEAGRYHLNPLNLLQLLSPRTLGGPSDYFGHDNYWENQLGVGWVTLILASVAVARSPRRRIVLGWAAVALVALLFAAGRRAVFFPMMYHLIPGMDRFRVPARSLFLAHLATSVLAGLGVASLRCREGDRTWSPLARRYGRLVLILAALLLSATAGARALDVGHDSPSLYGTGGRPHHDGRANRWRELARWLRAGTRLAHDPSWWGVVLGAGALLAWGRARPESRLRAASALGVLALGELAGLGLEVMRTSSPSRFLGADPVADALDRLRPTGSVRIRVRDPFHTDLSAVTRGFEKTNLNDSFQLQHAADLYELLYPLFPGFRPDPRSTPALRQAVLDRMGVALVASDLPPRDDLGPPSIRGVREGRPFAVWSNSTAVPRAYVVPRAEPAPDGFATVARFPTVPAREAVLMPFDPLSPTVRRQPFTPAGYDATDPDRIIVRVATSAPGLLVVADTWMPGWTALVDGVSAQILRGNRAQRVIPLPRPGRHVVVLQYRPPGLRAGILISSLSVLTWLALLVASRGLRLARRPSSCILDPASGPGSHRPHGPVRASPMTGEASNIRRPLLHATSPP